MEQKSGKPRSYGNHGQSKMKIIEGPGESNYGNFFLVNYPIKYLKVLAESDQMRKESDTVGPKAELDHWKKRMAKFNCLLDEVKSQKCKAVIGVLLVAKSRYLKVGLS